MHSTVPTIDTLFWPAANFFLYVVLMTYVYRRFARPVLRNQRIELEAQVVKAQNENATLKKETEQLRERLELIAEEKAELVAELEHEGRSMADILIATANQKSERLHRDATSKAISEAERLAQDVKREMVKRLSTDVSKKLNANFSVEEDKQFIKSFLSQVKI